MKRMKFAGIRALATTKVAYDRLVRLLKGPISRVLAEGRLLERGHEVVFEHEGNLVVKLPQPDLLHVLFNSSPFIRRNLVYTSRPRAEVLLRSAVYNMYKTKFIDPKESIVDIGCFIGDNAIPWATMLDGEAVVYAIDPSSDNIDYVQELARRNEINNLKLVRAVCADCLDVPMQMVTSTSTDNAQFFVGSADDTGPRSTTISEIVKNRSSKVGLVHVDVEGLELIVLRGAGDVIEEDRPVIIYEQHISKEDLTPVAAFLRNLNYKIFMLNEVVPGSSLDCRNFVAVPSEREMPTEGLFEDRFIIMNDVFNAIAGPALIPLN